MDSAINIGIVITYILFAAAVIGAIVFPIIHMLGDLKSAKGALIGILVLVAIFAISYAISNPETGAFYERKGISPTMAKVIGGGLISTYIVFAGAVISILYSQIVKWFK